MNCKDNTYCQIIVATNVKIIFSSSRYKEAHQENEA